RIPPRVATPITVTVSPDLGSSGQTVILVASGSSTSNGAFNLNGGALYALTSPTAVPVYGLTQTMPGSAGQLSIQVQVRGQMILQSSGFSVAAIPIGLQEALVAVIDGELTVPNQNLYDYVASAVQCDMVPRWWGLIVSITAISDSNEPSDLDQIS